MSWNEDIKKELGSCGTDVFIGHNVIFTSPKNVHLGNKVRIDPFCLITASLETKDHVHICAGAVLGGGSGQKIKMGNWTWVGYGSKLFTASEDYRGEGGPVMECWNKHSKVSRGNIVFEDYSGVASDVIVMPGGHLIEGVAVGMKSVVWDRQYWGLGWGVFYGTPLIRQSDRNKQRILEIAEKCG